ncbi:hypothetical protein BJY04DRAFT_140677 [Aspergillus karnatakaensis]|uniref:uncharacterized protein n=1 Tax=Aspergillus karnatakaensis TaxID=1810916 RepID=UPI003CCE1D77
MNESIEDSASDGRGSLKGFYSYKNTFDKDSVWLDIPKHVVFVDNSDPYAQDLETALSESEAAILAANSQSVGWDGGPQLLQLERAEAHGLEALSAIAAHDRLSFPTLALDQQSVSTPDSVTTPFNNVPTTVAPHYANAIPRSISQISPPVSIHSDSGNNTNIHFLLNPSQSLSPPVDPSIKRSPDSTGSSIAIHSENTLDGAVETDYEITFLLRHFSEVPGPWMDLYDLGTYFATSVPLKALHNPLLKYAACAQAAKQLGHVKEARPPVGVRLSQAFPGVQKDSKRIDWCWKGAKYYEKAIQLLMKELQPDGGIRNALGQGSYNETAEDNDIQRARRYTEYRLSHGVRSDEILAATAILSVYELLDATGTAWNRHLNGVKSLLDLAEVGMRPLQRLPPQPKRRGFSKARKATFWNFARQDYLAAFINGTRTRLHTEDLALWTEAGLQIDNLGFVRASNTNTGGHPGENMMKEDSISNALVWIISKIINFVSSGGNILPGPVSAATLGLPQQISLERWYRLEAELDMWYNGLPETFHPVARVGVPDSPGHGDGYTDDAVSLSEIWYSIPMCASAMQHYHMGRILLHIHKPPQANTTPNTITNRFNTTDIQFHSREIIGIGMACPAGSVRINSLQPLFVGGQCLTDPSERRMVLRLLRDIEVDLGWATEYRVKQLLREWGWDENTDIAGVS